MGLSRNVTSRQLAGQPDVTAPGIGHNGGPPVDQIDFSRVAPLRRWCKENGFSPTTVYNWEAAGRVILVRVGHRTHIVLDTIGAMIRKLAEEQGGRRFPSSNPKAKAREAGASLALRAEASAEPSKPNPASPRKNAAPSPVKRRQGGAQRRSQGSAQPRQQYDIKRGSP